jgi:hypothetical protein
MIKVTNLADQVIGESVYDGLGQRVATKTGDVKNRFEKTGIFVLYL